MFRGSGTHDDATSEHWYLLAACRGADTSLFYPSEQERGMFAALRSERAKAICRRCPVVGACLEWARSAEEDYGIWGGLTPDERDNLPQRASL